MLINVHKEDVTQNDHRKILVIKVWARKKLLKKQMAGEAWLNASYTIEAALLLPFLLTVIIRGMLTGIDCYQDVCAAAAAQEALQDIHPVEMIWKEGLLKEGIKTIYGDTVSEKPEK